LKNTDIWSWAFGRRGLTIEKAQEIFDETIVKAVNDNIEYEKVLLHRWFHLMVSLVPTSRTVGALLASAVTGQTNVAIKLGLMFVKVI
jgi:hypothetical protein